MPVPATLTSYLPVLLISVTHSAAPDDSSFSTLPEGQVDYLSHEWREEDVWRSWRSMTRQKNAIANGMRLENASWRTWWKQRNKLKTISPETLNWLKDSDVTWLYGPLHVGTDWTPSSHTPKATTPSRPRERKTSLEEVPTRHELSSHNIKKKQLPSETTTTTSSSSSTPKKPILKRRSISQLLSLPNSPFFSQGDTDEEEQMEHAHEDEDEDGHAHEDEHLGRQRPALQHTKSDTHIIWRGRPFRKDSPPRIIAQEVPASPHSVTFASATEGTSSERSVSTGSDQDFSGSSSVGVESSGASTCAEPNKKKHISFNTFVEQCIAIEKPKVKRSSHSSRSLPPIAPDDDGYEEDSELGYEDYDEEPSSFYLHNRSGSNSDSDEDEDDDVLEMRTSSSRSRSSSGSQPHFSASSVDLSRRLRPALPRRASTGGERATIAPIAPTILKTTGDADDYIADHVSEPSKELELVYVPPTHSGYSLPPTPSMPPREEVYHHRESYFSIGTHSPHSPHSRSPLASPPIPSVAILPPPHYPSSPHPAYASPGHSRMFPGQPMMDSPMQTAGDLGDAAVDDAFDYFDDQDGETFTEWSGLSRRGGRSRGSVMHEPDESMMRFAEGGAASVPTGRSSNHPSPSHRPQTPVVVVNAATRATEERTEQSRESSPSYCEYPVVQPYPRSHHDGGSPTFMHTPSPAVPVPRIGTSYPHISFSSQISDPALLSPPDIGSCRGRLPVCSSVSGSTTTGSSSYSRSTDSRSESRGRSVTRTSSLSDSERSGSRSSRGTNSPMGSISPTGSALGIGLPYSRGRERESKRARRSEEERGRDRTGRRICASASPPSVLSSPVQPSPAYSPILADAHLENIAMPSSPPSSISGSSTASSSTVAPPPPQQQQREGDAAHARPRVSIQAGMIPPIAVPSPIPEEEEQRSRQPTPANSPVLALHLALPDVPEPPPQSSQIPLQSSQTPPQSSQPQPPEPRPLPQPELQPQLEAKLSVAVPAPSTSPCPSPSQRPSPSKDRVARSSLDHREQPGTLIARAAEIVASARGFLGSIWNAGSS